MTEKTALWTRSFISITLINVLLYFAWQMFIPTMPLYLNDLGASTSAIGLSVLIATFAALIIRPFAGLMLDTLGRKLIFTAGLLIILFAMMAYKFFPVIWAVLAIRFLHGAGQGVSTTAATTIASDILPKKRFGEGMGFFTLSQSLSLALAPAAGLALYNAMGFDLAFVASGMLAAALLASLFTRHSYTIPTVKKKKFAPYEKVAALPAVVMFFASVPFCSVLVFISLYGEQNGIENIGMYFTICAIALFISRIFLGRLIDRYGYKVAVLPGFVLFAVSMVILALVKSFTGILIVGVMHGIAYGGVQVSLQTMAISGAPQDRRGAASATFFTGMDLGMGLGNLAAGMLIGFVGFSGMYLLMAIPPLIGLVLFILLLRKRTRAAVVEDTISKAVSK